MHEVVNVLIKWHILFGWVVFHELFLCFKANLLEHFALVARRVFFLNIATSDIPGQL